MQRNGTQVSTHPTAMRTLLALSIFCCTFLGTVRGQQPNVVLIFTDDQQFNALAANGNNVLMSPTMDQIASNGVRFTQARAALPVCSPSRAVILTGQYNNTNGVEDLGQNINAASPKLGIELQNAGYTTGVTGKWHLGAASTETAMGFDYYATFDANGSYYHRNFDVNGTIISLPAQSAPGAIHIDAYAADRAADFIDQANNQAKPFFLWHNTQTPHLNGSLQWNALQKNLDEYSATDFYDSGTGVDNLPGNWNDDLENKPPYYATIRNYVKAQQDYGYGNPNTLAQHTSEYYAVISELNDMLTPLMDKLDNTPDPRNPGKMLVDNTYVIFMADNGWLMGDHAMTSKSLPYDQSARVPFLVMGPGVDAGRVDDRQVSNIDIAPTILEMAGATVPGATQGHSLLNMLRDNGAGEGVRNTGIVEIWATTFAGNNPILAGYDGRYEVFYTYDSTQDELPSYVEIYDTELDPWELNNLADSIGENPPAFQKFRAIHADIQAHRINNLGLASHASKSIGNGETFTITTLPSTPNTISNQTIPTIIATDIEAKSGSRLEGVGIVLGHVSARSGAVVSVGGQVVSVTSSTAAMDFNALQLGPVTGQAGGIGWVGSFASQNSGSGGDIDVVTGELTAPTSTNYGISQADDHQHSQRQLSGVATVRRFLETDMDGVIWFSFLAQLEDNGNSTGGRAGISIDGHGGFSDNRFLLREQGNSLDFFVQGSPDNLADFTPSTSSINDTQLVVGKLTLASGNDHLEWWVNPDVSLGETGLGISSDMSYSLSDRDFDEDGGPPGVQQWSFHLYSGGHLDNFVVSNQADGFLDVTTGLTSEGGSVQLFAMLSPAYLQIAGDYLHERGATLELELFGNSNIDRLIVNGHMNLAGGSLSISLGDGFAPQLGNVFDVLDFTSVSGSFDDVLLPSLPSGLVWDKSQLLVTGELKVTLQNADFDGDGDVDGADFLRWQRGFGLLEQLDNSNGDANLDGVVDTLDLDIWTSQYGSFLPTTASALRVPAPQHRHDYRLCLVGNDNETIVYSTSSEDKDDHSFKTINRIPIGRTLSSVCVFGWTG